MEEVSKFVSIGSLVRFRITGLALTVVAIAIAAFFLVRGGGRDAAVPGESFASGAQSQVFPRRTEGGFVSSSACADCHPDQHSSWSRTYHHTMTQVASPETVVAPFDQIELQTEGYRASLERRGDEFWVKTVDPAWEKKMFDQWAARRGTGAPDPFENYQGEPPQLEAQVVLTTGSHHFQAYWIRGKDQELWQFPWRFHIGESRWIHRKDVFLTPPEWRPGMWFRVWNNQCSLCHSTGPQPGKNQTTGVIEDTKIGEFGIACEACHGPGEDHIRLNRESKSVTAEAQAASIVNPVQLDHRRAGQVCGQCHSHFVHNDPLLSAHGPQFRPGDNLYRFGNLMSAPPTMQVMSRFWADGANRSGGREFSGMSRSACFLDGHMSCVSCHSMHDSDPNDQLSELGAGNNACLQCHEEYRKESRLVEHTHHQADSTGSQCYNCHMPHTNYALFKAIRSHQVDVPNVVSLQSNTRPNACNLCHLDQTLQWSADHLREWYGTESPILNSDDREIAAGMLWALKGDAGQRVIAAWHMGWDAARDISGTDWMLPALVELMQDPYAAVRWVAHQSLKQDAAYSKVEFEFDAKKETRDSVPQQILTEWLAQRTTVSESPTVSASDESWARLLFTEQGKPDFQRIWKVLARRDNRMVAGVE